MQEKRGTKVKKKKKKTCGESYNAWGTHCSNPQCYF